MDKLKIIGWTIVIAPIIIGAIALLPIIIYAVAALAALSIGIMVIALVYLVVKDHIETESGK